MDMSQSNMRYIAPEFELYDVVVELGYGATLDGEASEIGGTKDEGEW